MGQRRGSNKRRKSSSAEGEKKYSESVHGSV